MTLADYVYDNRHAKRMTLVELASNIGVSSSHLSDIEQGKQLRPKQETLEKLAAFFGSNEDEVIALGGRIPRNVYYKVVNNPKLISYIRNLDIDTI